jgi:hypothetical protein
MDIISTNLAMILKGTKSCIGSRSIHVTDITDIGSKFMDENHMHIFHLNNEDHAKTFAA